MLDAKSGKFWLDFQYFGMSEMETGIAAYVMLSRWLHVATLRGSFEKLVHLFHEGNVLSSKRNDHD